MLIHHFAWVSPLVNFKKKQCSNKHKEVISNNGTNKGTSETKIYLHVGKPPSFIPMFFFAEFPEKWVNPLILESDNHFIHFSWHKKKIIKILC